MKTCSLCKKTLELTEFTKKKQSPDGYNPRCKPCKHFQDNKKYQETKEMVLVKRKKYYQDNKETILTKRELNKDYLNAQNREWHKRNPGYSSQKMKDWRARNTEHRKEYKKKYREENKELIKDQYKTWLNKRPQNKLAKSCRRRLREILKERGFEKNKSFMEYIGCSFDTLKLHIEMQFLNGMSWDNYGEWHIDHRVPLKSAKTEEQMYKLCHYTNLQPLWAPDNLRKNGSLIYTVKQITTEETKPFILNIHYAKRMPTIKYAFGLFANDLLVGVVTYGPTASPKTASRLVGEENKHLVLELNRLCLKNNLKNEASMLVGRSLKLLPKNHIVLSYSDTEKNHTGIVYQATNFKYYGLTDAKYEVALKSNPTRHSLSIYDESYGQENRAEWLKNKYGDDLYYRKRSRKHRYVYVTGNKQLYKLIKYKEVNYPKKDS